MRDKDGSTVFTRATSRPTLSTAPGPSAGLAQLASLAAIDNSPDARPALAALGTCQMLQGADAAALDDEEQELLSLLAEDEQPTGELLVQGGSAGDPLSGNALLQTAGRVRRSALPKTGFSKVRGCVWSCSAVSASSGSALRRSVLP